tara:strand:- start:84966 stop:85337 length:372 start_codon:yes stop_codon:yes gene_type:complete
MKESEDKNWKEEILKDFEKPTHAGFNDEVMSMIDELESKPAFNPTPLISVRQWFFTAVVASIIILLGVFVQYRIELDFGYVETYTEKFMHWINANMEVLWVAFALVGVFFVFTLMNQNKLSIK